MLRCLASIDVVFYEFLPKQWGVHHLLDEVAAASPPYHTLIDSGALITGMTNVQVATYLLRGAGLLGMEGVVFMDESDRQMTLLRAGLKVLELKGCGVAAAKRFTFFDQVHSTGVDVEQTLSARCHDIG